MTLRLPGLRVGHFPPQDARVHPQIWSRCYVPREEALGKLALATRARPALGTPQSIVVHEDL